MFDQLNFPEAKIPVRQHGGGFELLDITRRVWLGYTPEEWVRQHVIHFLIDHQNVPVSLIAVEMPIKVNNLERRCDIVVFNNRGKPAMVVECKASGVRLSQGTIDQAGRYNTTLKAPYLMVTNGIKHFAFEIDFENQTTEPLKQIPDYELLLRH